MIFLIDKLHMTKVLILGGGFSGVGVAQTLEKFITKKNDLEVAMVSDNNYFMFQPMLALVLRLEPLKPVILLTQSDVCVKKSHFIVPMLMKLT